jgi:uncharacterized protein (TIGR02217 family)
MSSLLFPTLPGQLFTVARAPIWNTGIVDAPCGMSGRMAYQQYPRYQWTVSWEVLRDTAAVALSELALLMGLFTAVRGQWDTFLYSDPTFNNVTAEPIGTGNGVAVAFPLVAGYRAAPAAAGIPELIENLNGSPTLALSGTTISSGLYSIGPTGIITFNTAPAPGVPITWTGAFYYRCMFSADTAEFAQFMQDLWEMKKLSFESIKL